MSRIAKGFILCTALLSGAPSEGLAQKAGWAETPINDAQSLVGGGGTHPAVLIVNRLNRPGISARSEDAGVTWREFSVEATNSQTFFPSISNSTEFYALSGGFLTGNPQPSPARMHRSIDRGATWQLVSPALVASTGEPLGNLAPAAQIGILYATQMAPTICFTGLCSYGGIRAFVSKDGGSTWQSIQEGLSANGVRLVPAPSDVRVVYAATSVGVYRSDNQGTNWRLIREVQGVHERQVVVDHQDANTVYVRPGSGTELLVTEDAGSTWATRNTPEMGALSGYVITDPNQAGRVITVGPSGETIQSKDRGRAWARIAPSSGGGILQTQAGKPVFVASAAGRTLVGLLSAAVKRFEITEQAFAVGSDIWWIPAESGSGWTIAQHASGQTFVVWYTYDAAGQPTWKVISGGTWTDSVTFTGSLYTTQGPALDTSFDPSRVVVRPAGEATLRFNGDSQATFIAISPDGTRTEKPIVRQLFGPPSTTLGESLADMWWSPSESGWGLAVSQQYAKVFATWFVYDSSGAPTWLVMPDMNLDTSGASRPRFTGAIYAMRGPASGAPYDASRVVPTQVGSASLAFPTQDRLEFSYSAFGRSVTKVLERQPF